MINLKRSIFIGVMSGTSLDGVDVVAVSFHQGIELHCCQAFELPNALRVQVLALCQSSNDEIEKMGSLDVALGQYFAWCCNQVIKQLDFASINAIGLHGQTIRHRPNNAELSFTLQIGDANTVSELTKINTVADFRRRDMAAGGQGAPLVPAFHRDLFSSPLHDRVIVNIGGMANITVLSHDRQLPILGFDTGPGNVLLDAWIKHSRDLNYDKAGAWASSGEIDLALMQLLHALPYFSQQPPKSTGREQFNLTWLQQVLSQLHKYPSAENIQRTLVELTALTICDEIKRQPLQAPQIFICGGGAHNTLLMSRITSLMGKKCSVQTTAVLGLEPDWVEAAAFAWLAKQTMEGLTGNCSSVTGAKGERILGAIYQA